MSPTEFRAWAHLIFRWASKQVGTIYNFHFLTHIFFRPHTFYKYRKEFKEGKYFNSEKHLRQNTNVETKTASSDDCPREDNLGDEGKSGQKYEPSMETDFSGSIELVLLRLKNPHGKNLCFSNVVASCLINIPILRKYLKGTIIETQRTISEEMAQLARHLSSSSRSTEKLRTNVMTKCLMSEQTNKNYNNNKQFDCVEFMQSLLEHFWKEQPQDEAIDEKVFGGIKGMRM